MRMRMVGMPLLLLATVWLGLPGPLRADKGDKPYKRGVELRDKGDLRGAVQEFEQALQQNPGHIKSRALLGLTHLQLGEQSKAQGDLDSAISEFQEAVRADPDEAYWHHELAVFLYRQGRIQEAFEECAQSARLSPKDDGLADGCGLKAIGRSALKGIPDQPGAAEFAPGAFSVGGGVSAPIPTYKPEPPYSEKARAVKYQGATVLYILVSARGDVEAARVIKPLGLGLDQKALETVRTWKFKPGMRNGVPVAVRVTVEINFRLS